jgi:hypothetical protein
MQRLLEAGRAPMLDFIRSSSLAAQLNANIPSLGHSAATRSTDSPH